MEESNFFSNYNVQEVYQSYNNVMQDSFNNGVSINENGYFTENVNYQQLNNSFSMEQTHFNHQSTFTYPHQLFEDNRVIHPSPSECNYENFEGHLFNGYRSDSAVEQYVGAETSTNVIQTNEHCTQINEKRQSLNDINDISNYNAQSIQNLEPTFEQMKIPLDEESLASLSESELNKYIFGTLTNGSKSNDKLQDITNEQTQDIPTDLQMQSCNDGGTMFQSDDEDEHVHKLYFNENNNNPILLIPGDSLEPYDLNNINFDDFEEEYEPIVQNKSPSEPEPYQPDMYHSLPEGNILDTVTDQTDVNTILSDGDNQNDDDSDIIEIVYMMPPVESLDVPFDYSIVMEPENPVAEPNAPVKTTENQRKQCLKPLPLESDICENISNVNYQLDRSKDIHLHPFKGIELPVLDVIFKRKKKNVTANGVKGKKNAKGSVFSANETLQECDFYKRKNEDRASYSSYEEKICVIPELESQSVDSEDPYYEYLQNKENRAKTLKCDKCDKIFKSPLSIYMHKYCIGKK